MAHNVTYLIYIFSSDFPFSFILLFDIHMANKKLYDQKAGKLTAKYVYMYVVYVSECGEAILN